MDTSKMIHFGSTKLNRLGKEGVLRPDSDGLYTMVIGGLNIKNHSGAHYVSHDVIKLFASNSVLMRRLENGALRGEIGHPKREPGMTDRDYAERTLKIYEDKVCFIIKDLWLDEEYGRNTEGENDDVIAIVAKIKCVGPYGHVLKEMFADPDQNVAFSMRCISRDVVYNGVEYRKIITLYNWDMVNKPGIAVANKYDNPTTEDIDDCPSLAAYAEYLETPAHITMEDSKELLTVLERTRNVFKVDTPVSSYKGW